MTHRPTYHVTVTFEIIPYRGTETRWRDLLIQRVSALAVGLGSHRDLKAEVTEAADEIERETHDR